MASWRGRLALGVVFPAVIVASACSLVVDAGELSSGSPVRFDAGPPGETDPDTGVPNGPPPAREDAGDDEDTGVAREAIVYRSNAEGGFHLWVMDTDGSNRKRLTTEMGTAAPTLSPDGRTIAYERTVDGNFDVWVMKADGTDPENLTAGVPQNDGQPWFSPDGRRIAFVSRRVTGGNPNARLRLWSMAADGSDVQPLMVGADYDVYYPKWAGGSIVFASAKEGRLDVWVKSAADTAEGVNRTAGRTRESLAPALSPAGDKIVFASSVSAADADTEIFLMNVDGTGTVQLTNNAVNDTAPSFSPDGAKIVYVSEAALGSDVWVMDLDGSNAKNLTEDLSTSSESQPHWGVYAP